MRRVGLVTGLIGLAIIGGVVAGEPELRRVTNSVGMELVEIPAGQFTMGAPPEQTGADADETPREVTIGRPFYLGAHEVTQTQFERVMGHNPGYFRESVTKRPDTGRHPVENVTWEEAVEFCRRLSELPEEKQAGRVYRLPTEAEWEYACRAGTTTAYVFGDTPERLGDHAWFDTNAETQSQPVGTRQPNAWGLHDMHGNVWEWCADWYSESAYRTMEPRNPKGPSELASNDPTEPGVAKRVQRGGSYLCSDLYCVRYRPGSRGKGEPIAAHCHVGFRAAR